MPAQSKLSGTSYNRLEDLTSARWNLKKYLGLSIGKVLFGVTLNQLDVVSDLLIARQYYQQGDPNWATVSISILAVSGLMAAGMQLLNNSDSQKATWRKFLMPVLGLVQLHMIVEGVETISTLRQKYRNDLAGLESALDKEAGNELQDLSEFLETHDHEALRGVGHYTTAMDKNGEGEWIHRLKNDLPAYMELFKSGKQRTLQEHMLTELWISGQISTTQINELDILQRFASKENSFCSFFKYAFRFQSISSYIPESNSEEMARIMECATLHDLSESQFSLVIMKAVESLTESTPQGAFQIYVVLFMYYVRKEPLSWLQPVSASMSVVSVSLALTDLIKSRTDEKVRSKLKLGQFAQLFVFNIIDIGLRMSTGALFLAQLEFRPYSFAACGCIALSYMFWASFAMSEGKCSTPELASVFAGVILTICMLCANGSLLAGIVLLDSRDDVLSARSVGIGTLVWVQRGLEFLAMAGSALVNRWHLADRPPMVSAVLFTIFYVAWLVLSIVLRQSQWLGYRRPQSPSPDVGDPCE